MCAAVKDRIFILDLHNTLYDEVTEYGGAMQAAIDYLLPVLAAHNPSVTKEILCAEIAQAHARLGSDWDEALWENVACLRALPDYKSHCRRAAELRREASRELTQKGAYTDTIDVLRAWQQQGVRLVLATEATENAAADALRWLALDGVIEAVYTWPYEKPYEALAQTKAKLFPAVDGVYLQKPHPYILMEIIKDMAVADGMLPVSITLDELIETQIDEELDLSHLEALLPEGSAQGQAALAALRMRVALKDGAYKDMMADYISRCVYIGDSFFKDGFLAQNSGLPFIHAAYGHVPLCSELYEQAKQLMYDVTGWERELLEFTQEAAKHPALSAMIKPDFICKKSLAEFLL